MKTAWEQFGFARVATLCPQSELGAPLKTAKRLIEDFRLLTQQQVAVVVTPELVITGYTCEDLFHSEALHREVELALSQLLQESKKSNSIWVIGAPARLEDGRLLNAAWVLHSGKVLGLVPKIFLPNMGEFYERRWFVSGRNVHEKVVHPHLGEFWVSPKQIFSFGKLRIGIEICHDLWAPRDPSTALALRGANVIMNLSASNQVVGKTAIRRNLVEFQSRKLHCAYVYVSAGNSESSKDTVFSGHQLIGELGTLLAEAPPFSDRKYLIADLDLDRIGMARTKDVCYLESVETDRTEHSESQNQIRVLPSGAIPDSLNDLRRSVDPAPFWSEVTEPAEILAIQTQGLARRIRSIGATHLIVGVSGGIDSTWALRVALEARNWINQKFPGKEPVRVVGVTLPGPGTSNATLSIARDLMQSLGVDEIREISIEAAVTENMRSIGKSDGDRSVVYENTQARQRTQILFNVANDLKGLVIGTGDLSELALGWCTFNADQMAHYSVNSGTPKTVLQNLIKRWSEETSNQDPHLCQLLRQVLLLPISPELLPPDSKGQVSQMTESIIGPFELHDFFLYHFLNSGFSREKIQALAMIAFRDRPDRISKIPSTIKVFYERFFSQQFKRTTLPPGPKIHSVSLSPRSDFRLPDEVTPDQNGV